MKDEEARWMGEDRVRFSGLKGRSGEVTRLSDVTDGLLLVGRVLRVRSGFLGLVDTGADDAAHVMDHGQDHAWRARE